VKRRHILILACALVLSVALLALAHFAGTPAWLAQNLPATAGADGILWQVQTTFLSVGFAGLAIAAQLFADAPLAIGASRGRVLDHVWAGWFVGVGLVANMVIAVETIWLPSNFGLIGTALLWFAPTIVLLVLSTVRLMQLFGNPTQLDEVVRRSLVEALSDRLIDASRRHPDATKSLGDLVDSPWPTGMPRASATTLKVPVPEVGRVVKSIKPKAVRQAVSLLALRATEERSSSESPEEYVPHHVTLDINPGDRTRLGETAFRITTRKPLDKPTNDRLIRVLQSSIELEPTDSVTPYEETDRDIANLKDAIGTSLRSGAIATAERALDLLGEIVRGVWMAEPDRLESSRRASVTRRDWLFRSIGEVEQDALLSPRVANIFVSVAMKRALEAPRTGSTEYVDECLRSFTRLWSELLRYGGPEFTIVTERITTCVQNLAAYSYSSSDEREDLQARGVWAMVELVKLALDAKNPSVARNAAEELNGLFKFDRESNGRAHVRGGQLVLSGWLEYLAETADDRDPGDSTLRAMVMPRGTCAEILSGRSLAERGAAPFSRWDWWEMKATGSVRAQTLELSRFVDRAQLAALASARGPLPPAVDEERAADYSRFLSLLDSPGRVLSPEEERLRAKLREEVATWNSDENERLLQTPLSNSRIEALRTALYETTKERLQLAAEIPAEKTVPETADTSRPILGMNFRVPRHYLVDQVFNQTYADPTDLGQMIAQGFADGEERKIVSALRALQSETLKPSTTALREKIEGLGDEAIHFVLLSPYGGLEEIGEWYSNEFTETLKKVTHLETGVLETEAFLFDRRSSLRCYRVPEEKEGLSPVEGTSIAVGVFEDVHEAEEPKVRIESGEYFVLWPADEPKIYKFGDQSDVHLSSDLGNSDPDEDD
jgi:hypothetical protein